MRYAEPDGPAYNAIVPALPDSHLECKHEEALAMAGEVIELCVESAAPKAKKLRRATSGPFGPQPVEISVPAV